MKKLTIILILALVAFASFSQGTVKTITADTVKGNEDVYFTAEVMSGGWNTLVMQMLATRVSTAAGGTASIQGSVDGTSYTTLNWHEDGCLECWFGSATADSACTKAFADAATQVFQVKFDETPWRYYRWLVDGDANDTMIINASYIFKKVK
jgi:hypothetical protein